MKQQEQLQQAIEQMLAAGMSQGQVDTFIRRVKDAGQVAHHYEIPSQSDGVTIRQSTSDAPGSYITTEQVAQDMYADALGRGEEIGLSVQPEGLIGAPPRALPLSNAYMSGGNPNYSVAEPVRTTVDSKGNIVHY